MYLCIYIATHLHTAYLDRLQAVLESNSRYAWRWWLSELRDTHWGRDRASLGMHLEAVIERVSRYAFGGRGRENLEAVIEPVLRYTWRPRSSKCGGCNRVSLDKYLEAVNGRRTGRWDSFISSLTPNRGYVTQWLYLGALMESWLMAVDCVGRHTGIWSYIQGSTYNHGNEEKANNLGWMLYSVYAVLGVCCTRWQLIIVTWSDREGWLDFVFCNDDSVVDEKERDGWWRWERCGGYRRIWKIRSKTCLLGLGRPCFRVVTRRIRTRICFLGDGQLTHTHNSLKSQLLMMICPISSHLSLARPQLYHLLRTRS